MFTDGDGDPIHPHAVYQAFGRIVRNAGLPHMRFHDLRHAHGSLLIKEGIPVKVVSERLGRSHIAHTIQTYQHLLPGMQADAAEATERRTVAEKVRIVIHQAGHVTDVHDPVIGDVNHDDDRSNGAGTGDEVSTRNDP